MEGTRIKKMCGHSRQFYLEIQSHSGYISYNLLWYPWEYCQICNLDTRENFKVFLSGLFQILLNVRTFVVIIMTK